MYELIWNYRHWRGFLNIRPRNYDEAYFDKYAGYAHTEMGRLITKHRIDFVNKYHTGELIDIGIGSGHFVETRPNTMGYDINPKGVEWLKEHGKYADPYSHRFEAYSFFDSFEHIKEPEILLNFMRTGSKVFVSIPIFNDSAHAIRSKHFRPDEHYWYFTGLGFVKYMAQHGFVCFDIDDFETRLGREDIMSFAFIKMGQKNGN